jgi:predicted component of viral defense system (DUF524 family)
MPSEAANEIKLEVGPRLYEETSYNVLLRSTNHKQVKLVHRDPIIVKNLQRANDGYIVHGPINFRSQIGRSRFTVYVDGKAEYDFEVEVFPSKLDYAADYNILLADVQDILTSLVLAYLRSTFKLGFAYDSASTSKLEWILLLRHIVDDLERGLRYVERHPHHGLVRERRTTRVERLRRPDATITKMVMQGKGQGPKARTSSGLVLHSKLPERRTRVTWDTAEHRWLASQLIRINRTLAEIHSEELNNAAQNEPRQLQIISEIENLQNRIAVLQRLEPIAEANGFAPAGFTSLTLQARPGYGEAYRACLILHLGLRVNDGPVDLSIKEIHRLYEYWCYLAIIRLLAKITGQPVSVKDLFSVEQNGLHVRLRQGRAQRAEFSSYDRSLKLTYNPRYSGEAFLLPQKPDVVLTFRDPHWPTINLVFDAKYRINTDSDFVNRFGSPGPPQSAIDALHRYRDAILEKTGLHGSRSERFKRTVIEGVALFPYVDRTDQFRTSEFWLSLERLGIGAIPFLPRETRYLEEWLRKVLSRGGWSIAESSISYLSAEQLAAWRDAEKQSVLVGVLRTNAKEHLDWIELNRCYYTALNPTQPRQLISRWVAIYSPTSIRTRGAITHLGEVENIEIKKRREIITPWVSERDVDERQVIYRLGDIRELEHPIENRSPKKASHRLSRNRWTSRLAILRATDLRELFLETSMEWRLYEQLQHAHADFRLEPGPARLQNEDNPRGRTWFIQRNLRVQYQGSAGFLIRRPGVGDHFVSDLEEVINLFVSP